MQRHVLLPAFHSRSAQRRGRHRRRSSRRALKSRFFQVIYVGWNCCHQYFWPRWPVDFGPSQARRRQFGSLVAVVFLFGLVAVYEMRFLAFERERCPLLHMLTVPPTRRFPPCSLIVFPARLSSRSPCSEMCITWPGFLVAFCSPAKVRAKFGSARVQKCKVHTLQGARFRSPPLSVSLPLSASLRWYFTRKTFQQLSDSCNGYGCGYWYSNFCRAFTVLLRPLLLLLLKL